MSYPRTPWPESKNLMGFKPMQKLVHYVTGERVTFLEYLPDDDMYQARLMGSDGESFATVDLSRWIPDHQPEQP